MRGNGFCVKQEPIISVRHSAVPGRLRLAVAGLRRHPQRKQAVEKALYALAGVRNVSANPLTGNVLVLFDPAGHTAESILESAEKALLSGQPAGVPWHALARQTVAEQLGANPNQGLTSQEAAARLRRFGPNRLPEPEDPAILQLVIRQLMNAPSALLGVGALLSILSGATADAVLIGAVLVANAAIGTATERSSHRAIAALRRTVPIRARVLRDGMLTVVDAENVVIGDTIQLLPGDPVPADARIWESHRLQLEESALTGESQPVQKLPDEVDPATPLADRRSMVFRGTTTVAGRCKAIVVATGSGTSIGQLRALAARATRPPTPLKRDLERIGQQLVAAAAAVSLGVLGLTLLRGGRLTSALPTSVALAVAAIPEGLPTTATTVLAFGSRRMREKGTLIRSLSAAEALGSVTVICADKTGTITENRMSLGEIQLGDRTVRVAGPALSPVGSFCYDDGRHLQPQDEPALVELLKIGVLCSDAEIAGQSNDELSIDGSPTEGALLVAAAKANIDIDDLRNRFPRIDRRDRGDGRRYMVTVHRGPNGLIALSKGAPDEMLEICDQLRADAQVVPLDEEKAAYLRSRNAEMAARAMRVLAFAQRDLPESYAEEDLFHGFTWCGLAGLVDPVRPGVPEAVQRLRRAGIRTLMITGDQAPTAAAVARELGLGAAGSALVLETGDPTTTNPQMLRELVRDVEVFARTPPEMKLAIVQALQENGEIVAMTGDGVNDAPALRAANVGIAMGQRGTELAKELADVVLSTDDFSRMPDAVEEGRLVRANVRRVLHYLLSTNASEVWAVIAAVGLGLPPPLTPGQLLWLNLVTDLAPAVALAMEPRDPDLMKRSPSPPEEPIIPYRLGRRILGESAAMATGSLSAYGLGILRHGPGRVPQTMAFWSLATAQLLHVLLARAGTRPASRYEHALHRPLVLGIGSSALLQAASFLLPSLRTLLGGVPLALAEILTALLIGIAPVAAIEIQRLLSAPRDQTGVEVAPASAEPPYRPNDAD